MVYFTVPSPTSSTCTFMSVFLSSVYAVLDQYACPAWDSHFVTLISALENIQKYALREFALRTGVATIAVFWSIQISRSSLLEDAT